jgi:hypothetical protein
MEDKKVGRRGFLSKLGIGAASVAATVAIPSTQSAPSPKMDSGSLRPKCRFCGERMLVRETATCPNVSCKKYGVKVGIKLQD